MTKHTEQFFEKQYNHIVDLINDSNNDIGFIVDLIKKHFGFNNFLIKIKDDQELFKKFIIKCDIDYESFIIIKNTIIKTCVGNYKHKYCIEYKLILIFQIINDCCNWRALHKCIFYESSQNTKEHYKTLYRQYRHWCLKDIFKNAFFSIVPVDNDIVSNNNTNNVDDNFYNIDIKTDLFIDATYISNKNGSEDVVVNPELTKKNVTKLTAVSDADGFIYSISLSKAKKKKIKYNNENIEIKTANHDVELIQKALDETNPNIKIYNDIKKYNLIGDKGYKTDKNFNIQKEKIYLISPDKVNQKKHLINRHQKRKLGYRYIIENSINGFKHNSRISIRKDGKSLFFMGWVHISCLQHNIKINKKKEKEYKDIF